MTKLPKISIVTPVYNCVAYIEETILSVINQGYPNLEYIIMDGGSTDGTIDIINKYKDRISVIHSGPDGGQTKALIRGFEEASGDVLCWLNGDDYYMPGVLNKVGRLFQENTSMNMVYGDYLVIDENGNLEAKPKVSYDFHIALYSYLMIPQPSSFWRKKSYEEVGGLNPSFSYAFDWDFFLRMGLEALQSRQPEAIRHIHDIYSVFRLRPDSKSVNESHKFNEEREGIIIQFEKFKPYKFRWIKKKFYMLKVLYKFKKERGFIPVQSDSRKA